MTDEVHEQVEDLRLDGHQIMSAAQFAPPDVKDVIAEEKLHGHAPAWSPPRKIKPISSLPQGLGKVCPAWA